MYLCIIYGRGQRGDQESELSTHTYSDWIRQYYYGLFHFFPQWNFPVPQNCKIHSRVAVTGDDLCDYKDLGKT